MGGSLRWVWPWANGDNGPLGTMVADGESPLAGTYFAIVAGVVLLVAALAVAGWWVPASWWRSLATAGAVMLIVLMALFLGPTKILPIALAAGTVYITLSRPETFSIP